MSAQPLSPALALISPADAAQDFYAVLAQQANAAILPIYHTQITPIQYPSQGDFNWSWETPNGVFNNATFNYVSAGVSPSATAGTVKLSPAGGFAITYAQLLSSLTFTLSSSDQMALNTALQNASSQAISVVSTYEGIFGQITPAQLVAAQKVVPAVQTDFDYVVSYILGSVWSGATQPLTWAAMKGARSLQNLMQNMPASGETVLGTVQVFLNVMGSAIGLQDELNLGTWILNQLATNTSSPSATNGGMQTVDPNTGAIPPGFQVAYEINEGVAGIGNDLNNSRSFQVSMDITQSAQSQLSVSFAEEAGFSFDLDEALTFSGNESGSFNLNTFTGTSSTATLAMNFNGFTMVPIAAAAWQQATDLGWYFGAPIAEAWQNWTSGTKPTGFNFVSDPTPILGRDGKGLGQVSNLLISQYPTVTITYSNADFSSFQQAWQENISGNLTLFGFIPVGSVSEGVYSSTAHSNGSNSSFTLTFTPSQQLLSVPPLQQTAYVIGGSFDYPATDSPTIVNQILRLVK